MGHIIKTPAGTYRANWRDATGRQKAKTFKTKKEAAAFLAETETAVNRGTYVDPHAGRVRFEVYAERWLTARSSEKTTAARDRSVMRTHVLPRWGRVPLAQIDHLAVQRWVTELGQRLAPATVAECFRLTNGVMRSAVRDRLIGVNPCEDVRLPPRRKRDDEALTITPAILTGQLLPAIPDRYRALVALAGGTGLRWGECTGLRWSAVDLDRGSLQVLRVAVEVAGTVTVKPYPKTKAGRRVVPLPPFVVAHLRGYRDAFPAGSQGEVFTNEAGGPLRRTLFRARVWRPSLVRAGLLGSVVETGPYRWRASWEDAENIQRCAEFSGEREAVATVARLAARGLRFHDLRHSYATWLVSQGVPVNDVQKVMGHERASTTLDRYTHGSRESTTRVLRAFEETGQAREDAATDQESGTSAP